MNGFWAWVAGPGGTLAGMSVALVVGTALGWLAATGARHVSRRERRELADAAADRAGWYFRRMRGEDVGEATDPRVQAGAATDPQRSTDRSLRVGNPPALPHPRKTSTAAFLDPTPYGAVMFAAVAPELAHEWEPAHVGAALAVANGGPIDTGEIRAITEDMDTFLEGLLAAHPVPYPDGGDQ